MRMLLQVEVRVKILCCLPSLAHGCTTAKLRAEVGENTSGASMSFGFVPHAMNKLAAAISGQRVRLREKCEV